MINQQKVSEVFVIMFSNYSRFVCNGYFHSYSALDKNPDFYQKRYKIKFPDDIFNLLEERAESLNLYIITSLYINKGDKQDSRFIAWEMYRSQILEIENTIKEKFADFVKSNRDFNFTPTEQSENYENFGNQIDLYCTTCGHEQTIEEFLENQEKTNKDPDYNVYKCHYCHDGKAYFANKYALKADILETEICALKQKQDLNGIIEKTKLKIKELQLIDPFYKDLYEDSLVEIGSDCVFLSERFSANRIRNDESYQYAKMGFEAYQKIEERKIPFHEYHNYARIIGFYLQSIYYSGKGSDDLSLEKVYSLVKKAEEYSNTGLKVYEAFFPQNIEEGMELSDRSMILVYFSAALISCEFSYPREDSEKFISMSEEHIRRSKVFPLDEKRNLLSLCSEMRENYFSASGVHQTNVSNISNISNIPGSAPVSNISSSQPAQRSYSAPAPTQRSYPSSNSRSDGAIFRDPERPQSRYENTGTVFRDPEREREARNSSENEHRPRKTGFCYIATAVYGSYDCPEVWVLRRFRDYSLAKTWYGRTFIKIYYKVSPVVIKIFGKTSWFNHMWRSILDNMVNKLQDKGVENTPYED